MVLYILTQMFLFVRHYYDNFVNLIFGLYYTSLKKSVSGVKNDIILESGISIAKKIRDGKVTSEEVIQAYIDRIKEVNPLLNAVVDDRFDEALQEAKEIDQKIKAGKFTEDDFEAKPFLGVPFTTKETTACKGLRHTFAIKCRIDAIASEDAEVVVNMKNAGGILLAITNVPQINMWIETNNPIYGRTNNPYDCTRNVGGSSGGEGSIIAACGSPLGIGTDIGGSIRIPSYMNGIFGFKCSPEIVSTKGTTYRTGDEGPTMVTAGPMAKYMDDIVPMFKVLIGKKMTEKLRLDEEVDVKTLNYYYAFELNDVRVSKIRPVVRDCLDRVVKHLTKASGKDVALVQFANMSYTSKLFTYMLKQENRGKNNFASDLANRKGSVGIFEALWKSLRNNDYTVPVLYNLIKDIIVPVNNETMSKVLEELKADVEKTLGDNGVLIFPSWAFTAEHHNVNLFRPFTLCYTSIWNVLKLPVLQVPLGLSEDGLPLGLQVIANTNQDRLCLAVGKELEKAFGGYVPPFPMKKGK